MTNNEHKPYSLGLSSKISKTYKDKTSEDIIKELDTLSPDEAFKIIGLKMKNSNLEIESSRQDYHELEGIFIQDDELNIKGVIEIKILESVDKLFNYITFVPYFIIDNKFYRTYLDFVLPDADVAVTYKWTFIYQNESSLPYTLSRTNIARVIEGIDGLVEEGPKIIEDLKKDPHRNISWTIQTRLSRFVADDLWEWVKDHGGIVDTVESSRDSFLDKMKAKPAEILKEVRKNQSGKVLEALEEAIENLYDTKVNINLDLSLEENMVTISDSDMRIAKTIDLSLIEGWHPCECEEGIDICSNREILEETVAKETSRLVGRKASNLGLINKKKELNKK